MTVFVNLVHCGGLPIPGPNQRFYIQGCDIPNHPHLREILAEHGADFVHDGRHDQWHYQAIAEQEADPRAAANLKALQAALKVNAAATVQRYLARQAEAGFYTDAEDAK